MTIKKRKETRENKEIMVEKEWMNENNFIIGRRVLRNSISLKKYICGILLHICTVYIYIYIYNAFKIKSNLEINLKVNSQIISKLLRHKI